jgi:Tfp pilus assembly protein PilX
MKRKPLILAGLISMVLSLGGAQARPCDTAGRAASNDGGAGPAIGNTGKTTTTGAASDQHPSTSTMNRAAGDVARSGQDAQKQMRGKPTGAQQAEGAKPTGQMVDKGC